jgi:HK97 gp10 family phage protein
MAKVEGLERLRRRFARIPIETKRGVRVALEQGADELVEMQKRLVPIDRGELRESIKKEDGPHELSIHVEAGDERAFYARWVEFGTLRTPASPYFFPAYRSLRRRIRGRISRAVRKAVRGK